MTHRYSGFCERCTRPAGSFTRRFCLKCRYDKVREVNKAATRRPRVSAKPHGKPQPVRFIVPVMPPQFAVRSWWAGPSREELPAVVALEQARMSASRFGRVRGGLAQDIY